MDNILNEALKVIESKQVLINVVSRRVRQLSAGARPLVEVLSRMSYMEIALTEIVARKFHLEFSAPETDL